MNAYDSGVKADTFAWWVGNGGGLTAGIAFLGTMCDRYHNTNLNELQDNDLKNAYVSIIRDMGNNPSLIDGKLSI